MNRRLKPSKNLFFLFGKKRKSVSPFEEIPPVKKKLVNAQSIFLIKKTMDEIHAELKYEDRNSSVGCVGDHPSSVSTPCSPPRESACSPFLSSLSFPLSFSSSSLVPRNSPQNFRVVWSRWSTCVLIAALFLNCAPKFAEIWIPKRPVAVWTLELFDYRSSRSLALRAGLILPCY